MTQPMNDVGFYPGISVELHKFEGDIVIDSSKDPIGSDTCDVKLILNSKTIFNGKVQRFASVRSVFLQLNINQQTELYYCTYKDKNYPLAATFDDLGIYSEGTVIITERTM